MPSARSKLFLHASANHKAAELLLTAEDTSLHNTEQATYWLNQVSVRHNRNPQYQYLLALSYKNREKTVWRKFFDHLQMAIFEGQRLGWDVSEWQALYDKYINGKITIEDNAA